MLLDAAADLLAAIELDEAIGGAVGVRRVASVAGVAPASVNHHFPGGGGGPNRRLCADALHHALNRRGVPVSERTAEAALTAADELRAGDPEALGRLARIAADHLIGVAPPDEPGVAQEAESVATLLAAAVAPRSPEATRSLRDSYAGVTEVLAPMYEGLLDASGRRLVGGIDTVDLTYVIAALADGFRLRRRFEAERMTAELFAETVLRIFESFSALHEEAQDPDPTDRLLTLPDGSNLDPHKREAVVEAAWRVYDRHGFEGLTLAAVTAESGVSRATVVANFRDTGGLAAAVWARFLPGLHAGVREDEEQGRGLVATVRGHVARLTDVARRHHALTGTLVQAMIRRAVESPNVHAADPSDPRVLVPLPVVILPVLREHHAELRAGVADTGAEALESAMVITSATLNLCITRQLLTPAEVAHRVCETTFGGMLRRRR